MSGSGSGSVSVTDPDLLPQPWRDEGFLREALRRWHEPVLHANAEAVLAVYRQPVGDTAGSACADDGPRGFFGIGEPEALADLASRELLSGLVTSGTLSLGTWELIDPVVAAGLTPGSPWDWMVTTTPPPDADAELVVTEIGRGDAAVVRQFHAAVMPESRFTADTPGFRWFGVRDDADRLIAVAGAEGWRYSVHLGGIATRADLRRRGIGTALVSHVARRGVEETGLVSLGLWSDNHGARRLYERLGFRITRRFESRHRS